MKSLLKPSLNWLLVFVPVAIVLRVWPQLENETALFICSCVAVVPLAGWMGRATEELAEHLGHGAGGLLSATFGNAAELIIALMALSKGLTGVVKASITGSIIGNVRTPATLVNTRHYNLSVPHQVVESQCERALDHAVNSQRPVFSFDAGNAKMAQHNDVSGGRQTVSHLVRRQWITLKRALRIERHRTHSSHLKPINRDPANDATGDVYDNNCYSSNGDNSRGDNSSMKRFLDKSDSHGLHLPHQPEAGYPEEAHVSRKTTLIE